MFLTKIFVTLLLIQSLQLTFAQQDDEDLGSIEALPRFEARRQSALNNKEDFEYDDEDNASRGQVAPQPPRTGRNDDNNEDDFEDNQSPQDNRGSSAAVSNSGSASVKGVAPSSTGRLSLPRFPGQQINSFVAPLPVQPRPTVVPVPVSISTPSAPITVVGKTNIGGDSSGTLSVPRLVRPVEPTKTVRVVKTRVLRPNPVSVDQSESLSSGVKSSQTVTRVVRPVIVQRQPQPAFVPVAQPVLRPVVPVAPAPVSIATPITSGSAGPNAIVSGGVKTVPILANSKVQPPRLRVVTTRRPTTPLAPVDVDEDDSASNSRPAPAQVSGVKTIAAANPVPLVSISRFAPPRTLVQPVAQPVFRQPTRLEVIYADEKLNAQEEDEDDDEGNAAGLSQSNNVKFVRPLAPVPVRAVPQPYLTPFNVQGPQPTIQTNNVFFQPSIQAPVRPTLVSNGKANSIKSTFNVRPQPVSVAQRLVPVAPFQPIVVDSGSASGAQTISNVQPPRVITTRRPATTVQIEDDEDGLASGVKGSAITSGSRPVVRTPAPTTRPLIQVREEPIPTFQQIDLIRTQPLPRPTVTIQEQPRPLATFTVTQPAPRPTAQPIVQIRDGAASAELPLPSPPRPIQIVRVTPAPTVRPITQVNQIRDEGLPDVQPVQISQPRLVPVAPVPRPQPQVIQISEPARPSIQVRDQYFQPLDPNLRPAIPSVQVTNQVEETGAPRETVLRQPAQPIQVVRPQVQQQQFVQVNQVQQPSVVETVQFKESAVPITSSQNNLGGLRVNQPQPTQTIVSVPQEPIPAPQQFEILRLREPSFPQVQVVTRQPQPLVPTQPRLIPAQLPTQTIQVSRPSVVQVSQEKETVNLSQPAPAPVVIQQRRPVSFPSIQQVQANVAPVAPIRNVQFVQQPQPTLIRQPTVPRLVAPLPLPQPPQEQTFFVQQPQPQPQRPAIVVSQPRPLTVQQPRPVAPLPLPQPAQEQTFFFQQPQPQPQRPTIVVSQPRPLTVQQPRPVAPQSVLDSSSQSGEQQIVQIREKASSIPNDFSQIEQIRLARA